MSQPIDCIVTFHNGVEINARLVITPLHGSGTVGRITEVQASGDDAEVAELLRGKHVNMQDCVIYLPPYVATYQESALRGP